MPLLIKNGAIVEESGPEVLDLEQWLEMEDRASRAVMLEPGETLAPLVEHLDEIPLVLVNFPTFMDGRGFSYGRELRERGFSRVSVSEGRTGFRVISTKLALCPQVHWGCLGGHKHSRLSRRKNCLTMRSSKEWKEITAKRPPGARASTDCGSTSSMASSSRLVAIRKA